MKYDGGRRAFLAALAACLGLLVFLFARRSVDAQMLSERHNLRVNTGLTLSVAEGNVATILGEGKLYASDMAALLRDADMKKDDIRDIIVGDGITEIGFDVFSDCERLQSLKLGRAVARIATGGLKDCPALKYLFFPAGLEDVGLDFMGGCKAALIVTDGPASRLPKFQNVNKKKRVLENVDSLEALLAAAGGDDLPAGVASWWQGEGA